MSLKLGELEVLDYEADLPRMDSNHDKVIQSFFYGCFSLISGLCEKCFYEGESSFSSPTIFSLLQEKPSKAYQSYVSPMLPVVLLWSLTFTVTCQRID
jgi:hypothetical protein